MVSAMLSSLTVLVAAATVLSSSLSASVVAATARWSRGVGRRRRGGAGASGEEVMDLVETAKCFLIYPGHWHRFVAPTGTNAPFSPGWCHQLGPNVSFQQPKGREAEAFGPGWRHQPRLKGGHWYRLVPRTGTNAPL